jgi:RNA polymerase sigma factor (sigma-70 family)
MASDQDGFLRATMGAMDLVFNLSRRLTNNRQDAEDLVQDTYLRAFRAWRDQRRPKRVEPWLATICLNLARSGYRTRARRPSEVPLEEWMVEPRPGADSESRAIEAVEREDLYRAGRDHTRRPLRPLHIRGRRGDGHASRHRPLAFAPWSPGARPAAR